MPDAMVKTRARSTHEVFDHHLQAFAEGLDSLVSDYAEDSRILLADRTVGGLADIRQFFADFLKGTPPGFWEAFKITRQSVEGEIAYLVWEAKPFVAKATDTLLVRDGKVAVQTFTAFA